MTSSRLVRKTYMLKMLLRGAQEEMRTSFLEIRAKGMDLCYIMAETVSSSYVESRTHK